MVVMKSFLPRPIVPDAPFSANEQGALKCIPRYWEPPYSWSFDPEPAATAFPCRTAVATEKCACAPPQKLHMPTPKIRVLTGHAGFASRTTFRSPKIPRDHVRLLKTRTSE